MNKIAYYAARIIQRVALFLLVGATIIHWIIMIVTPANSVLLSNLETKPIDPNEINELDSTIINNQSVLVMRWIVIASAITLLLLLIRRFRKYEKAMLVDSVVIILLCLLSVMFSGYIVRTFLFFN